jgi:pimeloyl-ACP methyl ester carboxylesterase
MDGRAQKPAPRRAGAQGLWRCGRRGAPPDENQPAPVGRQGRLAGQHWARQDAAGQWQILGEAAHKITSAQLYRVDEALEIYRCISAPTLAVEASDDSLATWWQGKYTLAEYHERLKQVRQAQVAVVQDAGHMLHHDQPEQLARTDRKLRKLRLSPTRKSGNLRQT